MSIPFALSLLVVAKGLSHALDFLGWTSLLPLYWTVWLAWHRLNVSSEHISYRRPFRREESLRKEELASVEVKHVVPGRPGRVYAPISTILVTATDSAKRLVINPRVFSLREMQSCVEYLKMLAADNRNSQISTYDSD